MEKWNGQFKGDFLKKYDGNRQLEVVYRRQAAGPGEKEADGRLQWACQVHISHSSSLAYNGVLPASHFHLVYEKRCGLSPGAGEWEVGGISILLSHLPGTRRQTSGDGQVIENDRWTEAILTWIPISAQTPQTPSSPVPLQRDSGTSRTLEFFCKARWDGQFLEAPTSIWSAWCISKFSVGFKENLPYLSVRFALAT